MAKLWDVCAFFIASAKKLADEEIGDPLYYRSLRPMLYYAQGESLARLKQPLFDERIEAWQDGPVVPLANDWFRGYQREPLTADMPARDLFTADEYTLLLDVWHITGMYAGFYLMKIARLPDTPWDNAWNKRRSRDISLREMAEYFKENPISVLLPEPSSKAGLIAL